MQYLKHTQLTIIIMIMFIKINNKYIPSLYNIVFGNIKFFTQLIQPHRQRRPVRSILFAEKIHCCRCLQNGGEGRDVTEMLRDRPEGVSYNNRTLFRLMWCWLPTPQRRRHRSRKLNPLKSHSRVCFLACLRNIWKKENEHNHLW